MKKIKRALSLLMMSAMLILPTAMPVQAEDVDSNDIDIKETKIISNGIITYGAGTKAKVVGNGVRLRSSPSTSGTILELMYDGEDIIVNLSKVEEDSNGHLWIYCKRLKTGTKGYISVDHYTLDIS